MLTFVGLAWPGPKCYIIKQAVMSFHIIGPGQARPEISTCRLKHRNLAESASQIGFFEVTARVNGFCGKRNVIMFQISSYM